MKLNKTKCEVLHTGKTRPEVIYGDGSPVKCVAEVKYLGCHLNAKGDTTKEVKARIASCFATVKKLDLFWTHSDCPRGVKILALDAVVRAKLLYGLHTAHLTQATIKRLDTLQLKGLRKILKLTTTYVNRANTNEGVLELANAALRTADDNKTVLLFSEAYRRRKIALYQDILGRDNTDPVKQCTMDVETLKDKRFAANRVGRPRLKWNAVTAEEFWQETKQTRAAHLRTVKYDGNREQHRHTVYAAAQGKQYNPHKNRR